MDNTATIQQRISDTLDNLSPTHKQVARFILDHLYFTSFASANEVAERIGTSAATVVRFAQALGYEGYPELQDALRTELPEDMTTARRMQKRMETEHPANSTPSQVFYTDVRNIEQTASNLTGESLSSAIDLILQARRIFIIGSGLSSAPAVFLAHSLRVMGFDTVGVHAEGLQTAVEFTRVKPEDLVIAVDLWRYVRSTVNAAARAREQGAPVIAVTDSVISPLSKLATISFHVATEGVAHSLSVTAVISLMNVLVASLDDRIPEQVYESLKKVDNAYRENDLLIIQSAASR